uniref:Uncharacterized protein n=1 Tax=Salvator merianae TaxID=96440 RepID=A0A8D0DKT1_SALMN
MLLTYFTISMLYSRTSKYRRIRKQHLDAACVDNKDMPFKLWEDHRLCFFFSFCSCLQLKKFRETVESLSKAWMSQNRELEYESAYLAVAVKLSRYLAQKACNVAHVLAEAINGNPQVKDFIERQGGSGKSLLHFCQENCIKVPMEVLTQSTRSQP